MRQRIFLYALGVGRADGVPHNALLAWALAVQSNVQAPSVDKAVVAAPTAWNGGT